MHRFLLFIVAASLAAFSSNAQHARVTHYTAPYVGSVVLSEVEDKYNAQVNYLEMPSPDANVEKKKLYEAKEQVSKQFPYQRLSAHHKTTAAPQPVVAMGFVADSFVGTPPDNDMAISKQNIAVSVVNSNIAVLNGQTGQMTVRKGLKGFSSKVGLSGINDYRYDPKIIYDPEKDRFICVMLNDVSANNWIVIGFSRTNDPAGAWNFYKFYGNYKNDSTWFDYPCIAITKDEFFLTGNKIKFNASWQAGFSETVIYQIRKQDGYDSVANLNYSIWDGISHNGRAIRNLYPVKGGGSILGPQQYFLSNRNFDVQNDTIFLVKVPDVIGSGNTNLDIQVLKSPLSYGVPPDGRQPDTSVTLATNDGRILGAFAEGDDIQFVSTSVHPVSGSAAVYHGKIANYKTSPSITHAQFFSVDTLDFGYPNIAYAGNPWGLVQSLISFNYTGPGTFPGMGAILFDGSQYSELVKVKEGSGSIKVLTTSKQQRWGDYMGAQPDWNTTGTIWIEGIYGRADARYGNWMAKLNSPLLGIKQEQAKENNGLIYPNPAWQFIRFQFRAEKQSVIHFTIVNSNGQLVDHLLAQKCKAGLNEIQFDIAPLAAGIYYLKAVNENGEPVTTQRFIKP